MAIPPYIPNRYDTDEARLRRLEAQAQSERRKWLVVLALGIGLLLLGIPLFLLGWSGVMLMLAPLGLGMILGAGIQLLLDRGDG